MQAVVCFLPDNLDIMKQIMTHNKSINTFDNMARHVELEVEHLKSIKFSRQVYVTDGV